MNKSLQIDNSIPAHKVVNRLGKLYRKHYFATEKMTRKILFAISSLLLMSGLVNGQSLKIKNETGFTFEKVITFKERDEGRHTYDYNPKYKYGGRDYSSPVIQKDTLNFTSRIKFAEVGKYTLKFISTGDTICYLFGLNLNKTKKIILDKNSLVYSKKPKEPIKLADGTEMISVDKTSDHRMIIIDDNGRIDLYFNFINNTSYTIYAIYPWISDEDVQRGTILHHNPERKILPKEQRKITVIEDRLRSSYNNQKISFVIVALDSESNLVYLNINNIKLSADDILINNKNIKLKK